MINQKVRSLAINAYALLSLLNIILIYSYNELVHAFRCYCDNYEEPD